MFSFYNSYKLIEMRFYRQIVESKFHKNQCPIDL